MCGLPDQQSLPVSTNICTLDLSQQNTKVYVEGGQGEDRKSWRTAGSKGIMCGIAGDDFRKRKWEV